LAKVSPTTALVLRLATHARRVLGEPSAGEPATSGLGEQTRTALHSRRARAMAHRLGIRRQTPQPGDEWLLDWAVMGQETLGGGGEQYALVVITQANPRKPYTSR